MPIYRTGMVMASIYDGDTRRLRPWEKLLFHLLNAYNAYAEAIRLRWQYAQRMAQTLYREGLHRFFVPAAGLPIPGHVHHLLPDAQVLYLDNDPDVVREGQRLIGKNPKVRYVHLDLTDDHAVREVLWKVFGPRPVLGVLFIGASYFLTDVALATFAQNLYAWLGPGSKFVVDRMDIPVRVPRILAATHVLVYRWLNRSPGSMRDDSRFRALLHPWQVESVEPIVYVYRVRPFWYKAVPPDKEAPSPTPKPLMTGYKLVKPA